MWDHKKLEKTKREEAEKLMKEEGMVSEEMVDFGVKHKETKLPVLR